MNLFDKIGNWWRGLDKDDVFKWGLLGIGGLMTFGAGIFDQKIKDRQYKNGLAKTLAEQAKRLQNDTDGNA